MKHESKNAKKLHNERKRTYKLVDEYHRKYIDPDTLSIYDHMSIERDCPVCQSKNNNHIFHKSASSYYQCNECSMVFLNPILNEKSIIEYYKNLNTDQGGIVSNESAFYTEIYTKGLNSIQMHNNGGKEILDIGCSTGFFLDICKKNGFSTTGIELGIDEANVAKKKGHNILTNTIQEIDDNKKYDVITMWDVFEHIPNGAEYFNLLKNFLKPDGVLFMQIPNSDSIAAKCLREKCRMFDGLEHTNLYNPKSIELLASNCDFNIVNIESVISEISVLNNYLDYKDPYFGESIYNSKQILNFIDEELIHQNFIGYKLQICLKR